VEYEGKILLAKRGIEPRKDYWNLPCGFLEMNENVEGGAAREVYEETGVTAEIQHLQSIYNVVHSGQVYLIFLATTKNPQFKESFETIESKFFHPDEIPWDDIAFSSNTFALKKYLESKSSEPQIVHIGSTLS
jgi:ADP-ribose pyrophosphatase YjhB (NUDIX family)